MSIECFAHRFPEVARNEAHVMATPKPVCGVPVGAYFLREYYCDDLHCDCRRVILRISPTEKSDPDTISASITYGWERVSYYKKWTRNPDPAAWRDMASAQLDPLLEQSEHAEGLLKMFKAVLDRDRTLIALFRRHYKMVRDSLKTGATPIRTFSDSLAEFLQSRAKGLD